MQYAAAGQNVGDSVSTPCNCEAYDFPHRPGGGDCHGHNLADCPSQIVVPDPHGTGDRWYRWVEHGCRNWVDNKHQARAV